EGFETVYTTRGLGVVVNLNPDTRLVWEDFALAQKRTAAGSVAHVLRARHGADVFHLSEHAVATSLAAEHRLFEYQLGALDCLSQYRMLIDPGEDGRQEGT